MTQTRSRADYAPTEEPGVGAWIASVEPGSPAYEAGLEPGMRVLQANGHELGDIIDWRWEADGGSVELVVVDSSDGLEYLCELEREPGQDWGIEFTDVLFDGERTCRNACVFCFMEMLPKGVRSTLSLRDDDYRLSFLQGNFVTLTNLSDADVDRIVERRLEPMNVSLHAVTPEVRARLMGRNAARGMEVLERLCEAGIEVHAQVVVCPGENDGAELARTLDWVEAHPTVTSIGLVPLGYTRFSPHFSRSFSDEPERAREVIEQVRPYQERARAALGVTKYQLSDEFYLDARMEVPSAEWYDGYPQFYDGIGMLRSFMDETDELLVARSAELDAIAAQLEGCGLSVLAVCGGAAEAVVARLLECSPLSGRARALAVPCAFFGGNVDVTGLICGSDLEEGLPGDLGGTLVMVPDVLVNSDGLLLDDWTWDEVVALVEGRGGDAVMCGATPAELVGSLASRLGVGCGTGGMVS